ncbi:MAG: two-component system, NtrC family, nitrogen regulation response regulator GlnG [Methyloprofundus sp.]|nr:MAG: two-component system, NtrC family, nitrogen regulation response regulator GlnG [Methyloprofundus sp.]
MMNKDNFPKLNGISLLLVDDDPAIIRSLGRSLRGLGATVRSAGSVKEAGLALASFRPDVVLSDLQLKDGEGLELVSLYLNHVPDGHFYLITGYGSVENAVKSIKLGVKDYFQKPLDPVVLAQRLLDDLPHPEASKRQLEPYLLFKDPLMEQALCDLPQIASNSQSVLIHGESGTGKELVARAVHELSSVSEGPFIALNCGAIPESLLEDELFGHEKGAFTGAQKMRKGHFEQAHGGTLFLDEIGEMPLNFQVRLLRVLEDGMIQRVGSEQSIAVKVRIIAATHRNLEKAVTSGLFRQDLLYRLNILPIQLPPLRMRPADIQLLAKHFLQRALQDMQHCPPWPELDAESLALLTCYDWPGNVRELRNIMTRLAVRLPNEIKHVDVQWVSGLLPQRSEALHSGQGVFIPAGASLAEAEQILIDAALAASGGNRIEAAKSLGMGERTLRRKLNHC